MTPPTTHSGAGPVLSDGREPSLWLTMLRRCLVFSLGPVLLVAVAAAVVSGWQGAASTLFAAGIVIAFSAITLLIGHLAGPSDPTRAMLLFLGAYGVKVVGFGAVLLGMGRPGWIVGGWFLGAALATLLAWQVAELRTFATSRQLLYAGQDERTREM